VNIYAFKSFTTADMVSASAGGTFSGNVAVNARLDVDNIRIDGNTISSTDTNGDINIIPDGTGEVVFHSTADSDNYVQVSSANNSEAGIRFRGDGSLGTGTDIGYEGNGNRFFISTVSSGTATERLSMDSNGNVGIGTSPAKDLHVSGGTDTRIRTEESGGSMIDLTVTNSGHLIDSTSTGDLTVNKIGSANMIFKTANTERMRITSSGEAIMGATSTINSSKFYLKFDRVPNTGMTIENTNGTSATSHIKFQNNNGTVGSVTVSGSSTSFNTSSDHRLKENVVDMTGAIDRVKQLAPKRFNFIADADTTVDGFLAHEAQTVVPEAVHGEHNEVDDDGNAVMQGIDQSKLVPLLTGALQEAIAKIETLETKVAALEDA